MTQPPVKADAAKKITISGSTSVVRKPELFGV
jgi:hypothetical protein